MVAGDPRDRRERGDAREDPLGQRRMGADDRPLLVGELVGLVEDAVGDRELAEVVEQARAAEGAEVVGVEVEAGAEATAISATPSEWRPVYGDLASTTRANASAMRSRPSSSATSTRSAGSTAVTAAPSSEAQKAVSSSIVASASTSAGSNHVPRRRRAIPSAPARPSSCRKTSIVCARQRIRPGSEIAAPLRPAGRPPRSRAGNASVCWTVRRRGAAPCARAPRGPRSPPEPLLACGACPPLPPTCR